MKKILATLLSVFMLAGMIVIPAAFQAAALGTNIEDFENYTINSGNKGGAGNVGTGAMNSTFALVDAETAGLAAGNGQALEVNTTSGWGEVGFYLNGTVETGKSYTVAFDIIPTVIPTGTTATFYQKWVCADAVNNTPISLTLNTPYHFERTIAVTDDTKEQVVKIFAGSASGGFTFVVDNFIIFEGTRSLSIKGERSKINVGKSYPLGITQTGSYFKDAVWSSSDSAVASVDANGVLTGNAAGNATITLTRDNLSDSFAVEVKPASEFFLALDMENFENYTITPSQTGGAGNVGTGAMNSTFALVNAATAGLTTGSGNALAVNTTAGYGEVGFYLNGLLEQGKSYTVSYDIILTGLPSGTTATFYQRWRCALPTTDISIPLTLNTPYHFEQVITVTDLTKDQIIKVFAGSASGGFSFAIDNFTVFEGARRAPVITGKPIRNQMNVGDTVQLGIDENGSFFDAAVWTSSNPSVASVDAYDVLTANAVGMTTITLTRGNLTNSFLLMVRPVGAPILLPNVEDFETYSIDAGSRGGLGNVNTGTMNTTLQLVNASSVAGFTAGRGQALMVNATGSWAEVQFHLRTPVETGKTYVVSYDIMPTAMPTGTTSAMFYQVWKCGGADKQLGSLALNTSYHIENTITVTDDTLAQIMKVFVAVDSSGFSYVIDNFSIVEKPIVFKEGYVAPNKYVYNLRPGVTKADFAANSITVADYAEVVFSGLGAGDLIATGTTVEVYVDGAVIDTYVLIIPGDANADGLVNNGDVETVKAYMLEGAEITGPCNNAANVCGENKITLNSLLAIQALAQ